MDLFPVLYIAVMVSVKYITLIQYSDNKYKI